MILLASCAWSGCVKSTSSAPPAAVAAKKPKADNTDGASAATVTLDDSPEGRVVWVNYHARFVILNFPSGILPSIGRKMSVYRGGLKMAEIKITGPQEGLNLAADILSGDVMPKDEVRDE